MRWGVLGGLVGFSFSLLGSLVGVFAAVFVGAACGRRCAAALEGTSGGAPEGARAGLVGGALASPVFVVGAAAGALVAVQGVERGEIARILTEFSGLPFSPDEAWALYLVSIAVFGLLQAAVLVGASTVAGALAKRSRGDRG